MSVTLPALLAEVESRASSAKPLESRRDFIRTRLPDAMQRQRGRKRLRKKKAEDLLHAQWGARSFAHALAQPLHLYRDYAAAARRILSVEPLPDGPLPAETKPDEP